MPAVNVNTLIVDTYPISICPNSKLFNLKKAYKICPMLIENQWFIFIVVIACFQTLKSIYFSLDNRLVWPSNLVTWTGKIYHCWRNHLADPLCVHNPEEKLTQEFLRYYILGCECMIGTLLEVCLFFYLQNIHIACIRGVWWNFH